MAADCEQQDCFKEEFKRYKRRSAVYTDVIDFRHPELFTGEVSRLVQAAVRQYGQPRCTVCHPSGYPCLYQL